MGRKATKKGEYKNLCFDIPKEIDDQYSFLVESSPHPNKTQFFIRYVKSAYRKKIAQYEPSRINIPEKVL